MLNYHFYIQENIHTTNKQGLKNGVFISKIPVKWGIKIYDGNGPYSSLKELKLKSRIYIDLKKNNLKRAQQVVNPKNIFIANEPILIPKGFRIEKEVVNLIIHSTAGRIKKGKITGVHFFDTNKVRIVKLLIFNKLSKVFKAKIDFYDTKSKKWIQKNNPSSFFPTEWSKGDLVIELNHAYLNKTKIVGSKNLYKAKTLSNINVEIVIVNEKVKSIYPII